MDRIGEQQRLAGGGCGLNPGGQLFVPREEVVSGYNKREVTVTNGYLLWGGSRMEKGK